MHVRCTVPKTPPPSNFPHGPPEGRCVPQRRHCIPPDVRRLAEFETAARGVPLPSPAQKTCISPSATPLCLLHHSHTHSHTLTSHHPHCCCPHRACLYPPNLHFALHHLIQNPIHRLVAPDNKQPRCIEPTPCANRAPRRRRRSRIRRRPLPAPRAGCLARTTSVSSTPDRARL